MQQTFVQATQKFDMRNKHQTAGYEFFFNYELNTKTWRHFVNKQILQTYHRLLIEK